MAILVTGGDSQPPEPEDDDELVVDVARDGLKGLMRFRFLGIPERELPVAQAYQAQKLGWQTVSSQRSQ